MSSQRSISIVNRSDVIVHYQWKTFATIEEEESQKLRFLSDLSMDEEKQQNEFLEECVNDPILKDSMSILTRTFKNKRKVSVIYMDIYYRLKSLIDVIIIVMIWLHDL